MEFLVQLLSPYFQTLDFQKYMDNKTIFMVSFPASFQFSILNYNEKISPYIEYVTKISLTRNCQKSANEELTVHIYKYSPE